MRQNKGSLKPIVLMIDEVDSASNNQIFLDFLAQLRKFYLQRDMESTFQSVILAGVHDIKNMKMKLHPDESSKSNSPWNISADFDVDMSFSVEDIGGMLQEYEADHHTGMCVREVAELIYDYTSGYPFLVSRICKIMDEKIYHNSHYTTKKIGWNKTGILAAVKLLLAENNTLFESLIHRLYSSDKIRA